GPAAAATAPARPVAAFNTTCTRGRTAHLEVAGALGESERGPCTDSSGSSAVRGDGTVPEASPGRPATSWRHTTTPRLLPSGLLPSVLEFHQVNRLPREPGRGLSPPVQTFTDPGECGSFASHPSMGQISGEGMRSPAAGSGGSIVNFSSEAKALDIQGQAGHAATTHGLLRMTKSGSSGIRVRGHHGGRDAAPRRPPRFASAKKAGPSCLLLIYGIRDSRQVRGPGLG